MHAYEGACTGVVRARMASVEGLLSYEGAHTRVGRAHTPVAWGGACFLRGTDGLGGRTPLRGGTHGSG
jgi:hypothetical protein